MPPGPVPGPHGDSTSTDDRGHFEFFVPPGPARVLTGIPGSVGRHETTLTVPDDRDPEPIQLAIGGNRPVPFAGFQRQVDCDVRIRLRADAGEGPPSQGRSLSGRVFDHDGSPVVGLRLYLIKDRRPVDCATDRLGVFRLKGLPPGKLQIQMCKHDQPYGVAIIPPEAVEVDLTLPKPVERSGVMGH